MARLMGFVGFKNYADLFKLRDYGWAPLYGLSTQSYGLTSG